MAKLQGAKNFTLTIFFGDKVFGPEGSPHRSIPGSALTGQLKKLCYHEFHRVKNKSFSFISVFSIY